MPTPVDIIEGPEIVRSAREWEGREWFPPGPQLAICLSGRRERLADLTDDELLQVAAAARRQTSWAQARELAAIAELTHRRTAVEDACDAEGDTDYRTLTAHESVIEEVAAALTVTGNTAATLVHLAEQLTGPLAATGDALEAGQIDMARARVICDTTNDLPASVTQQVQSAALDKAPGQTTGQLRRRIKRLAHRLAPDAIAERRRHAERQRRLERWDTPAGTTDLALCDLPPEDAHVIYNKITAAAHGLKTHGDTRPVSTLRADLATLLLKGVELPNAVQRLLTQPDAATTPAPPPTPAASMHSDPATPQSPAMIDRQLAQFVDGVRGLGQARNPTAAVPFPLVTASAGADSATPALTTMIDRRLTHLLGGVQGLLGHAGDATSGPALMPATSVGSDPAVPESPAMIDRQLGQLVDGVRGFGQARNSMAAVPFPLVAASAGADSATPALTAMIDRRLTHLLGGVQGMLGHAENGTTAKPAPWADDDTATLGSPAMIDRRPTRLASSVQGLLGHAGDATSGPALMPATSVGSAPAISESPAMIDRRLAHLLDGVRGLLTHTKAATTTAPALIPAASGGRDLPIPGLTAMIDRRLAHLLAGVRGLLGPAGDGTAAVRVPMAGVLVGGDLAIPELAAMVDRRLAHLRSRTCAAEAPAAISRAVQQISARLAARREALCQGDDARHGRPGYRPPASLRREVEARHATCVFPTCNQPSHRCDLDHTIPWRPGITCRCNLAPLCRRHHRLKQSPGWKLHHIWPGLLIWTTPSGRWHIIRPDRQ